MLLMIPVNSMPLKRIFPDCLSVTAPAAVSTISGMGYRTSSAMPLHRSFIAMMDDIEMAPDFFMNDEPTSSFSYHAFSVMHSKHMVGCR